MLIFETERLRARQWTPDDAVAAFELWGDPEVARYIGGKAEESVETARAQIRRIQERNDGYPKGLGVYALTLRDSGEIVGACLIKPLPDGDGNLSSDIEMGWHLMRRHWDPSPPPVDRG